MSESRHTKEYYLHVFPAGKWTKRSKGISLQEGTSIQNTYSANRRRGDNGINSRMRGTCLHWWRYNKVISRIISPSTRQARPVNRKMKKTQRQRIQTKKTLAHTIKKHSKLLRSISRKSHQFACSWAIAVSLCYMQLENKSSEFYTVSVGFCSNSWSYSLHKGEWTTTTRQFWWRPCRNQLMGHHHNRIPKQWNKWQSPSLINQQKNREPKARS